MRRGCFHYHFALAQMSLVYVHERRGLGYLGWSWGCCRRCVRADPYVCMYVGMYVGRPLEHKQAATQQEWSVCMYVWMYGEDWMSIHIIHNEQDRLGPIYFRTA